MQIVQNYCIFSGRSSLTHTYILYLSDLKKKVLLLHHQIDIHSTYLHFNFFFKFRGYKKPEELLEGKSKKKRCDKFRINGAELMMCLYFLLVLTLMYMMLVVGQLPLQINLVTQAFPFLCLGAARNKTFFSLATQTFYFATFQFYSNFTCIFSPLVSDFMQSKWNKSVKWGSLMRKIFKLTQHVNIKFEEN